MLGAFDGVSGKRVERSVEGTRESVGGFDEGGVTGLINVTCFGEASEHKAIGTIFGEPDGIVDHCVKVGVGGVEIGFGTGKHDENGEIGEISEMEE